MRSLAFVLHLALGALLLAPLTLGCGDDEGGPSNAPGDGDGDGDGDGNGDGDGDGDDVPEVGDGDGDGDDEPVEDLRLCFDRHRLVPSDCRCAEPGEACFVAGANACVLPGQELEHTSVDGGTEDDAGAEPYITCDDVCEASGKTCAENRCGGKTFLFGHEAQCAHAGGFRGTGVGTCDQALPFWQPYGEGDAQLGVTCCCR